MASFDFPGGASSSLTTQAGFVGFRGLRQAITTPNGAIADINGNRPIIITSVRTGVSGRDRTVTISFEIGGSSSALFTRPQSSLAPLSDFVSVPAFFLNSTNVDFRIQNTFVDEYIRYRHVPATGSSIFAFMNTDTHASVSTLQTNRSLVGTFNYIYAPSEPRSLSLSSEEPTSVTLNWVAPSNTGDTGITDYLVQWSLNSNFSGAETRSAGGNVNSYSITGLSLDRTYYFRVAAKNAVTDTAGSHSAWSGTIQKNSRPNTPSISVSRSGLGYSISGSATIGDGSISSYEHSVRSSTDGGVNFGSYSNILGLVINNVASFTGSPATSYQFRIRARSATGIYGEYATSSVVHTPAVPLIPTTEIAVSKNVRKVTVDWDAFRTNSSSPAVYNGAAISSYQVEARYSNDNGATWVISYTNIGNVTAPTTVLITGDLLIAKTYQFRVRAVSDVGNSAYQSSPLIFISAYGQRRGSTGFLPIETAKRFDGTSWQTVLMAKRFNGTTWVDLTN
jgi:hypothetical protein